MKQKTAKKRPPKPSRANRNDKHQTEPRLTQEQRAMVQALRTNPQRVVQLCKLLQPASPKVH